MSRGISLGQGVNIKKGVVDVKVDINPICRGKRNTNKDEFVSRASAMTEEEQLGNLPVQFVVVLFCIPSGPGDDWKAFANVNRWDSYYNDE